MSQGKTKRTNDDDEVSENLPSLTMDEVWASISEIARNGRGPDRFKALALLQKSSSTPRASSLPPPATEDELIQRLGRLIKAAGAERARRAYRFALPRERRPIDDPEPAGIEHLPQEVLDLIENKIHDTRSLYRHYPELKRPGRPTGFPIKAGPLAQKRWCQLQAKRCHADRLNLGPAAPKGANAPDAITPENADEVRIVPAARSLS